MGNTAAGQSIFSSIALALSFLVPAVVAAQRSGKPSPPSPLHGTNFIGAYIGGNLTAAAVDKGQIPAPNSSFSPSGPGGAGFEFGLTFSRLMPDLFVSTSTTAEFRLHYARLVGLSVADGTVSGYDESGSRRELSVSQSTTITTTIAGGELRFAFDTRPMAQATPTILLGITVGHIADMEYQTDYDPAGVVVNNSNGVPDGSVLPARRWFYSALHLGGGGRISLGDPATSPAIVPEVEFLVPLTSLSRFSNWLTFGIRGAIGLRWPL